MTENIMEPTDNYDINNNGSFMEVEDLVLSGSYFGGRLGFNSYGFI
jgi:hypothetical protein